MSDFVFNVAKGRISEMIANGDTIKCLLLKGAGTDAVLKDLDTISAVLAEASTTEADATNYVRQTLGGLTSTPDDSNDRRDNDCNDIVFSSIGGASNNSIVAAIFYKEVTNDSDNIPLCKYDVTYTTNGNTLTLNINALGFHYAA